MPNLRLIIALLMVATMPALQAQKSIPDVNLKSLDGKTVKISDLTKNGKITVLSFWATWCSPCKKELDAVADLYPEWQKDYNMQMIAITVDDSRSLIKVKPMVTEKGWEYIVLSDVNKELQTALNFQTVPQTFLLDSSGQIVWSHSGYNPGDEFELEEKIKKLKEKM
ncbi:MAG: TlpA disulfide reductase family protein [Saprospiraceae bacterium]